MWFLIFWLLSIVACFFIGRKIVEWDSYEFYGEPLRVVMFFLFGMVPFLNVVLYVIFFIATWYEKYDIDEEKIMKKIFFIKDDE